MARPVSNLGEASGKADSREWVLVAVTGSLWWKRTLSVTFWEMCGGDAIVLIFWRHVKTLYQLVRRFRDTGSVVDRRRNGTPKVVTLEGISDVHLRILRCPHKFVRCLSQQMGASRESTPNAQKSLNFHAYRVKAVQELRSPDVRKSHQYCLWLLYFVLNNLSFLYKTFFIDEAWFNLNGYINSQNTRI
jgi:hypothetical protein